MSVKGKGTLILSGYYLPSAETCIDMAILSKEDMKRAL